MAGVAGLEPANDGIKTRCLTNLATPQISRLAGRSFYQGRLSITIRPLKKLDIVLTHRVAVKCLESLNIPAINLQSKT